MRDQYLCLKTWAAALGCLCLVSTPFLFPTTRVTPGTEEIIHIRDSYLVKSVDIRKELGVSSIQEKVREIRLR